MEPATKRPRADTATGLESKEQEQQQPLGTGIQQQQVKPHGVTTPMPRLWAALEEGDHLLLLLAKTRIERIIRVQKVITVNRWDPLQDALKQLVDANILSAPVLTKQHQFFGFLDMLDIVNFVLQQFGDRPIQSERDLAIKMKNLDGWAIKRVGEIIRTARHKARPYHAVPQHYSVFHITENLAYSSVRRVPIIDSEGQIIGVVTQSMLIDFLNNELELLGEKRNLQVKDLKWPVASGAVVSIRSNATACSAFKLMVEKGVGGLPVVDEQTGALVDSMSIRDLRGLNYDASLFWRLWEPIYSFKAKIKSEFEGTPKGAIYVLGTDTLETVIKKMVENRVHRIFVVNDETEKKPVRVISQSDVLQNILRN